MEILATMNWRDLYDAEVFDSLFILLKMLEDFFWYELLIKRIYSHHGYKGLVALEVILWSISVFVSWIIVTILQFFGHIFNRYQIQLKDSK